jgi:hypothetical protein
VVRWYLSQGERMAVQPEGALLASSLHGPAEADLLSYAGMGGGGLYWYGIYHLSNVVRFTLCFIYFYLHRYMLISCFNNALLHFRYRYRYITPE